MCVLLDGFHAHFDFASKHWKSVACAGRPAKAVAARFSSLASKSSIVSVKYVHENTGACVGG
eukprot:COSAG05_NODE_711_length_7822_cov_11.919720_9_plen_62_part_00